MKFKDLKQNQQFRFQSETTMPNSGMKTGPWIKISFRKYKHADDGMVCQVGSINVDVTPA